LPEALKLTFEQIIKTHGDNLPNMIFSGKAGVGKTTVARAICDELDHEYILKNASEDGNIDTLRTEIRDFASTTSFNGRRKVVIFDEADYLNVTSTQPALRGFIDEFAINVSFIFTCNTLSRIIEPIHSRVAVIDFVVPSAEKNSLMGQFLKRIKKILTAENITYNSEVLAKLIFKFWPDLRRTLN
jgi:DNA polymerase III delta prime subunit